MTGVEKADKRWFGRRPGLFVSNSRFYILMFSFTASVFMACYFRTSITGDTLYSIRLQQVYGSLALLYLYLALIATPLSSIFGKQGVMRQYLYSRRALGVSAAYFATLHGLISLFGQLGGLNNLTRLPWSFQQTLLFGFVAYVVLFLMAATSFDKAITWMTFRRWKWLHRFVYASSILIFLHVWAIGTHVSYQWVRWSIFITLAVFAGLESWRVASLLKKRLKSLNTPEFAMLIVSIFICTMLLVVLLPKFVDRYHANHDSQHGENHKP